MDSEREARAAAEWKVSSLREKMSSMEAELAMVSAQCESLQRERPVTARPRSARTMTPVQVCYSSPSTLRPPIQPDKCGLKLKVVKLS